MLHGRMLSTAGRRCATGRGRRGLGARLPRRSDHACRGFLGVVAEREWDAAQVAERFQVTWSDAAPPFFEMPVLYDHIRQAPVVKREVRYNTASTHLS
jgi:nicotinate dehydrogenase subunit B